VGSKPPGADDDDKKSKPDADGAVNPMAPLAKVEQAGNTVELASEVIVAGSNPFLDRLPKPIVEAAPSTDTNTVASTAPPADPLDSIALLGIAYHPKAPMALISVTGADAQTQMVRKGDILTVETEAVKVANIGPESVELQRTGASTEKRTLNLPSIIGFGSSSTDTGGENSGFGGSVGGAKGTGGTGSGKPPSGGAKGPDLSNLSRLSTGASSVKSPAGAAKGADVSLKEP
jgi:hypothetical protein